MESISQHERARQADTRSCADWRAEAARLESKRYWGSASMALEYALDKYPASQAGQLAARDKAAMRERIKSLREFAYSNHHDKGRMSDGRRCCTAIDPLTGGTSLLILEGGAA